MLSPPPARTMLLPKFASMMSAPTTLSTPSSGSTPAVPAIPAQEAAKDSRQLAKEVLMDILTGILLRGNSGEGRKGQLETTRGRRKKREISVEEQMRAEERRRNLRSKKGRGE